MTLATSTKTILSDENYYSSEAGQLFMSASQYKDFQSCELMAWAKLNEGWEPERDPTALLVGNYVHSYFESQEAHKKFTGANKDKLYSKRAPNGLLKAFQVAEDMITALERQQAFVKLYQGEKEHIVTGEIAGVQWKGKIDCLNVDGGYFVDIKTSADLTKKVWNERFGQRVSWIADFGYYMQMAVYRELLQQEFDKTFTPIIAAVSKQSPPAFKLYTLDEYMLQFEMDEVERNAPLFDAIKNGEQEPVACGNCEYCRGHLQVTEFSNTED